jgi:hypothetical protein
MMEKLAELFDETGAETRQAGPGGRRRKLH